VPSAASFTVTPVSTADSQSDIPRPIFSSPSAERTQAEPAVQSRMRGPPSGTATWSVGPSDRVPGGGLASQRRSRNSSAGVS
jgi:hypothetical protein